MTFCLFFYLRQNIVKIFAFLLLSRVYAKIKLKQFVETFMAIILSIATSICANNLLNKKHSWSELKQIIRKENHKIITTKIFLPNDQFIRDMHTNWHIFKFNLLQFEIVMNELEFPFFLVITHKLH
jgi:hypothetical protein